MDKIAIRTLHYLEMLLHIRLLENFAVEERSPGVPKTEDDLGRGLGINAPIEGQIWYNKTQGILFVYNGVSWLAIGGGGGGLDIPTADARYVNISGDTMTGFLTLHATPTNNLHAATKQYVDDAVASSGGGGDSYTRAQSDDRYVNTTGDTMTGFLTLHATPTNNLHAATKQYVDDAVASSGGGGGLDIPTADARYVNISGDTMTGFLTLHATPTNSMHAATKQYVDASSAGFPTNTQMVFYQASAPTGWVQISSITTTYALRVVAYGSSGGSSGGTDNPFTMDKVPSHRHVVSGNTGAGSPHNHNIYGSTDPASDKTGGAKGPTIRGFAGSYGSAGEGYFGTFAANGTAGIQNESSHAHAISITSEINSGASVWAPRYLDVIVARKS